MPLVLEIKVIPRSSVSRWALDKSGCIICYVKSPPEHNRANHELITKIAKTLSLEARAVTIMTGKTARKKRIKIEADISYNNFLKACGLEVQNALL